MSKPRRLDQILASHGYGSRREVREAIAAGRVTLAGVPVKDPSSKALSPEVCIDGSPLEFPAGVYVIWNKPAGCACSHDPRESPLIYDLLPARWLRRNPVVSSVGRLDRETTGLLLLTDDTQWQHRLTSPRSKVEKVYRVTLDGDPVGDIAGAFASGTLLLAGEERPCAPARLTWHDPRSAEVTLTEGRYHQVRRMFSHFGLRVVTLHRTRFGPLDLLGLPPGHWRELTPEERAQA